MEELKIVGGYIRVSTQEQSQRGLSLESQKSDIEDYCKRNGYKLFKLYIDRGITARKNLYKRAAFMEMMQDARKRKINHIVVIRLDRFFRNVYDYHRMMHEFLDPAGCGWSAVKEEYNTTTTNGRLMINLRLSIAEQECDQDSDRIRDVFENRIRDGFVVTGSTPIGLKIEGKKLVPSEDADLVRDMFSAYLRFNSVAKTMNYIKNKYGKKYDYTTIRRSLSKELYIGKKRGNESYCEPLVSKEVFYAVQRNVKHNVKVRSSNNCYVFTGLLRCGDCGRSLIGCNNRGYIYYRCNGAFANYACTQRYYYRESFVEEYLLQNVERLMLKYKIDIEASEQNREPTKSNREQIEKKISRLKDLYINGMMDITEFKKRKAALESQIIDVEVPQKKDLSAINAFLSSGFRSIYNDLSAEEKQSLWRSIIKEIRVKEKVISEVVFL